MKEGRRWAGKGEEVVVREPAASNPDSHENQLKTGQSNRKRPPIKGRARKPNQTKRGLGRGKGKGKGRGVRVWGEEREKSKGEVIWLKH